MYFIISALLKPLMVLVIMLVMSFIFYARKRRMAFKVMTVTSLLWFLIISTPFVPDYLVSKLENRYPPLSDNELPDSGNSVKIMVMGAGHINDLRLSFNNQLTQNALGRLIEGIRLYKKLPGSRLILSGWGFDQPLTQAQTLALAARSLGVLSSDIIMYNNTENTSDEAKEYAKNAIPGEKLFVVSNASHMPRVIRHFNNNEIYPVPVCCNYSVKESERKSITYFFPESSHIIKSEKAMHEYLGILVSYFE